MESDAQSTGVQLKSAAKPSTVIGRKSAKVQTCKRHATLHVLMRV